MTPNTSYLLESHNTLSPQPLRFDELEASFNSKDSLYLSSFKQENIQGNMDRTKQLEMQNKALEKRIQGHIYQDKEQKKIIGQL